MKRNASTFVNSSKDGSTDALKVMARPAAWIIVFCSLSTSTSLGASPCAQRLQQQRGLYETCLSLVDVCVQLFCDFVEKYILRITSAFHLFEYSYSVRWCCNERSTFHSTYVEAATLICLTCNS